MRILVTGSASFQRSHHCERLLNESGQLLYQLTQNIENQLRNTLFKLIRNEVTSTLYLNIDDERPHIG